MQVSIQLDHEQISALVYQDLCDAREQFIEDMECDSPNIFSANEIYDKILIQKHIEALDLILEWYRDPSE
jgi:hypothetical protein